MRASGCVRNAGAPVTSVKFDNSGQYLAVGGMDARIYGVKQEWQLLSTLSDLPQKVSLAYSHQTSLARNFVHLLEAHGMAHGMAVYRHAQHVVRRHVLRLEQRCATMAGC